MNPSGRHTAPFANFVLSHSPSEMLTRTRKRHQDQDTCAAKSPDQCSIKNPALHSTVDVVVDRIPLPDITSDTPISCASFHELSAAASSSYASGSSAMKKARVDRIAYSPTLDNQADSPGGLSGGHAAKKVATVHCQPIEFGSSGSTQIPSTSTSKPIPDAEPQGTSVFEELHNVFRTLWTGQRTVFSPSSLLATIWTHLPSFKGYKQQDAQEFLSVLLDRLQCEMHGDVSTTPLVSRDFISRTFLGYSASHIQCTDCNHVACIEEPFSELSLALPPMCYTGDANECDLTDLLQQFVSPTAIDGSGYACQECNRRYNEFSTELKPTSGEASTNSTPTHRYDRMSCESPRKQQHQQQQSYNGEQFLFFLLSSITLHPANAPSDVASKCQTFIRNFMLT